MCEMADGLDEKFRTDTNTLICISSGDRAIRALAARLNVRLCALRKARLRLQNGDAALKNAITKVSHDLRTPLTAICGYLDLLESQMAHEKQALSRDHSRTHRRNARDDRRAAQVFHDRVDRENAQMRARLPECRAGTKPRRVLRRVYRERNHSGRSHFGKKNHGKNRSGCDSPRAGQCARQCAKYSDGNLKVTFEADARSSLKTPPKSSEERG